MISEDRAMRKRRELMRLRGKPANILPHEKEEALRILHHFHDDLGMSQTQLAHQLGTERSTVQKIMGSPSSPSGTKSMRRSTYEAIKALRYEMPVQPEGHRRGGAKVSPIPSRRRLQALNAAGYPQKWLGDYMGYDARNLSRLIVATGAGYCYAVTHNMIAEVYEKLAHVDPADMGIGLHSANRARNNAAGRGYAPPSCWDSDTIDRLDARPEWTGACGTPEGYRIHVRETIFEQNPLPLCDACRDVVETRALASMEDTFVFNHRRFAEVLDERGTNPRKLARVLYGDEDLTPKALRNKADVIYRWRDSSRQPRNVGIVQRVADALDVPVGELLDQEATKELRERPLVGHGLFNPYVLRAAIEMSGLSFNRVGEMCGVTGQMAGKWVRGEGAPSEREKLKPLAEHFGVPVRVFYE